MTYIVKFIMADSEDEFMPICVAASAAFVAMCQTIYRPGVGRASGGRQYQTYLIPPADVVRASARHTTPGRCHDFWNSHNRRPTDAPRRPADAKSAGRLSEFPALQSTFKSKQSWRSITIQLIAILFDLLRNIAQHGTYKPN